MGKYYHIPDKKFHDESHDLERNTSTYKSERNLTRDGKNVIMVTGTIVGERFSSKYVSIIGYQLERKGNMSTTEPIPENKRKELSDLCIKQGWAPLEENVSFCDK